jgi:hypothetical protein
MRLVVAAAAALLLALAACGDDDGEIVDEPSLSGLSTTPADPESTAPTPTATAGRTASLPEDPRLQAILAEPSLVTFLVELAASVEANDVDWLVEHMHFADYECTFTSGLPAEPDECHGSPGRVVQVIGTGAWQSDGAYFTAGDMRELLEQQLLDASAHGATLDTIGQMSLGDEQEPDVADVLITGTKDSGLAGVEHALSFAIASVDGAWAVTEVDRAIVEFVPEFYDWWVSWDEIELPTG